VVLNPDGTVTYTPNVGFKGIDAYTYTISDGTDTATATVTISVANALPVAVDDDAATAPGTATTIDVLATDFDPNGDPLTVVSVTQPAGGTATGVVVLNPDGTVTFTPHPAFRGTATFTYTISDGTDIATATVTVVVTAGLPLTGFDLWGWVRIGLGLILLGFGTLVGVGHRVRRRA
jgi:hypothetical protein